jgi:hypothetical protein
VSLVRDVLSLDEMYNRAVAIADEAFGIAPVETFDATLTRIERGIAGQRARILELERALDAHLSASCAKPARGGQ